MSEQTSPGAVPMDRTAWALERREPVGCWFATVDGLDAGQIWAEEDGRYSWLLDGAENPFDIEDSDPSEPTLEAAYARIREAWGLFWQFCSACGDALSDDDRRWLLESMGDLGAYCPCCRGEADPPPAWPGWEGRELSPAEEALRARGDYIGPAEAAALLSDPANEQGA